MYLNKMNCTNYFFFFLYNRSNNFIFPLLSLNIKIFSFNNSLKYFIHSTAILKSNSNNPLPQILESAESSNRQPFTIEASSTNIRSPILEEVARLENERLSQLKVVNNKPEEEDELNWESKCPFSTYAE